MNLTLRIGLESEKFMNVKVTWTKDLFRFVFSGTMDCDKGGLTYTWTYEYGGIRTSYSRSKYDLILH